MQTKTIADFTFVIGRESVLVTYHKQAISLNNFNQRNKAPLKRFCDDITNKNHMDINTLYRMARIYELNVMGITSVRDSNGTNKIMW